MTAHFRLPASRKLLKEYGRRGVSLIEALVVISVMGSVFAVSGIVLQRLILAERQSMHSVSREVNTSRLAERFRKDVHESAVQRLAGEAGSEPSLELKTSAESPRKIVYSTGSEQVLRQVVDEGAVVARDVFRLPGCVPSFSEPAGSAAGEPAKSRIVAMQIERRPPIKSLAPAAKSTHLSVDALLGRDIFEVSKKGGEKP